MQNYDGSGSVFALGTRMTKLAVDGSPLPGPNNCYVTDSLVQINTGLTFTENDPVEQKNGRGQTCVYYKPPDTVLSGLIEEMIVCTPDPNILQFLIGGAVLLSGGTAEAQTVTITGAPTGGAFTLTFEGATTGNIPYDATMSEVQAALDALPNVNPGDITVTGTGPYVLTFGGTYAGADVPQVAANGSGLTGGTDPDVTVETTTAGGGGTLRGYAAPSVNVDPVPNGVALEAWANRVRNNAFDPTFPYWHWVWPRAKLRLSENLSLGAENAGTPQFAGNTEENPMFGAGPLGDLEFPTNRVWQYWSTDQDPTTQPGFYEVVAPTP